MMNFNLLNGALESTNGNEFKVLYLICNTLSLNKTNRVKIYRELFAEKCNLTEKQISRITNELERKGLIKKDIVSNGRTTKNYYSLNIEPIKDKNVPLNNIKGDKNVPLTDTRAVEDTNVPNYQSNLDKNVHQTPSNLDKNVPLNNIEYKEIKLNKINNIIKENIINEKDKKKVEIKKDFSLNNDTLKMEFENEFKNEFENNIEKKKTNKGKILNTSTLKIERAEQTKLNNSSTIENTKSKQSKQIDNSNSKDNDFSMLYECGLLDAKENNKTNTGSSTRNVYNFNEGQLSRQNNEKPLERQEMAQKGNYNNTKTTDNDSKAGNGSGLNYNPISGELSSPSNKKRLQGLKIALNPIFKVVCCESEFDLQEMEKTFEIEVEGNTVLADEQEKAILHCDEQQREYQEEQQTKRQNDLNYKEVFAEFAQKIKYCKNSVSLNAIYERFRKYAQQIAQNLNGSEFQEAAVLYNEVKEVKDEKNFTLKAKGL